MTVSDMIVAESKEARQKNILMCQEAAQGKVDNRWLISKVNNHIERFAFEDEYTICLLYTSPSQRD